MDQPSKSGDPENRVFNIEVDGEKIPAREGQTIAAALLASGKSSFGTKRGDSPRGVYCGIGLCYECRMTVNGRKNIRTCVTLASPGCKIRAQYERIEEK
jgi:hypothetical protein